MFREILWLRYALLLLSSVSRESLSLTLDQATSRPHRPKTPPPPPTAAEPAEGGPTALAQTPPTTPSDGSGVATYRYVDARSDSTCILVRTDAVVEVRAMLRGTEECVDAFVPSHPLVEGNCADENLSFMRIAWTGYILVLTFEKTPGGERWFVSKVELTVSTDLPRLQGIANPGHGPIKLYNTKKLMFTPVGHSYECRDLEIPLSTSPDDRPPEGVRGGALLLRLLHVQPFMYRGGADADFGEVGRSCDDQGARRGGVEEGVPLAVGTTLMVAVVLTVAGYAVYRCKFRGEKGVRYDTME